MADFDYLMKGLTYALSHPKRVPREVLYEINYQIRRINNIYYRLQGPPDGYNLVAADWDTAIILDACRYDVFAYRHPFEEGILRKEIAVGSTSREFIKRSFDGGPHHDIVYVTANPHLMELPDDTFHAVYIDELWDEEHSYNPRHTTRIGLQAHAEHSNKRIIIHYMQPHLPFIHPDYRDLNGQIRYRRGQYWPVGIDRSKLKEAYAANLGYVCSFVKDLRSEIDGKVIITSDHGELLGECQRPLPIRGYNHHAQLYIRELLEVPWLEFPVEDRRNILEEPPVKRMDVEKEARMEQLEALGYM